MVEGENLARGHRNRLIGTLEVPCRDVRRSLPAGSEVEITLEVDESRILTSRAWIPFLDQEFEQPLQLSIPDVDVAGIREEFERQRQRLESGGKEAEEHGVDVARTVLDRVKTERMVEEVEAALGAADGDRDAADKAQYRLLDLALALDEVEDAMHWPALVAKAREEVETERRIVESPAWSSSDRDRARFRTLEAEIRQAIQAEDRDLLRQRVDAMDDLGCEVVQRHPGWWAGKLEPLAEKQGTMGDPAAAARAVADGRRAVSADDLPGLKAAVRRLAGLLPRTDPERVLVGDATR